MVIKTFEMVSRITVSRWCFCVFLDRNDLPVNRVQWDAVNQERDVLMLPLDHRVEWLGDDGKIQHAR